MKKLAKLSLAVALIAPLMAIGAVRAQNLPIANGFDPYDDGRDPATAIKFNLSPPGARSLAMGGAFLGLADDATAAYTNPAGLTNLALGGSEVAVEVRQSRFTTTFTDRGHYPTNPSFNSELTFIGEDSVLGLPPSESKSETSGLSFLSFGYVMPGGLTLAIYRHELANFRSSFESQGPFNDFPCDFEGDLCFLWRVQPRRADLDLEVVNFGVSAAYGFDLPPLKGLQSNLSVGLGISYYELDLDALSETFLLCHVAGPVPACVSFDENGNPVHSRLPGSFFGPADFSRDNHFDGIREVGDDSSFGFSLGFLWKLGREQRWSLGGVFRQGPDFSTTRQKEEGHHTTGPEADGPFGFEIIPQPDGRVTVPDVFGLGVAFRTAAAKTKITLDVNRVRYSQTLADFSTTDCTEFDFFTFECTKEEAVSDFQIPDVTQVHLGFERTVLVVESLFVGTVRFGAWHEPFHEPEYVPSPERLDRDLEAVLRRQQSDETHVSIGFGLVIKEDYQIDLAADISDPVTTFSFSLVKFF